MVDTAAWLFPTFFLIAMLILGFFLYRSMVQHPLGDLEMSSMQASSSAHIDEGKFCLIQLPKYDFNNLGVADHVSMPAYPPHAHRATYLTGVWTGPY
jgi:hypothetical protein